MLVLTIIPYFNILVKQSVINMQEIFIAYKISL